MIITNFVIINSLVLKLIIPQTYRDTIRVKSVNVMILLTGEGHGRLWMTLTNLTKQSFVTFDILTVFDAFQGVSRQTSSVFAA